MTRDKSRKTEARQRAQVTGESYTRARHQVQAQDRAPAVFSHEKGDMRQTWEQLIERLDQAEELLEVADPYTRANAYQARARIYIQLYAQTTDAVYGAACARASVCDDITAARIRFEHGIPTLRPRSEVQLLGLSSCSWCGRAWQVSAAGACPHCPRLLFGPSPSSAAEAAKLPPPSPAADPRDRDDSDDDALLSGDTREKEMAAVILKVWALAHAWKRYDDTAPQGDAILQAMSRLVAWEEERGVRSPWRESAPA